MLCEHSSVSQAGLNLPDPELLTLRKKLVPLKGRGLLVSQRHQGINFVARRAGT